ncbi:DUF4279 domain-containing protein [Magnetovibrio sp.]|uniref:DUF4279 domain-containing protein n=1 Tax=Magnetovibrio sp. TaxID=2024836 RepID=UPI002F922A1E
MFENDDGTLSVQVGIKVVPSVTTPQELLDHLSSWSCINLGHDEYHLESTDYYYGKHWPDHVSVLNSVIQDVVPVLRRLISEGAAVTVRLLWTGKHGAQTPQVASSDLGLLDLRGVKLSIEACWDQGNHEGEAVHVSFCVYGPDPDRVSAFWGQASKAIRVGEPFLTPGNVTRHGNVNAWIIDTQDFCSSSDPFEHIAKLYERLGPPTPEWRGFIASNSAEVKLHITCWAASGNIEPVFSYDELKKIGSYGAEAIIETTDFHPNFPESKKTV